MTRRQPAGKADADRARTLVLAHGWNATAYQILNPGIEHWFAARGDAVVGFVDHAGTLVVAGAPVCSAGRLLDVVGEFVDAARSERRRVCFFGAGDRLEQALAPTGRWSAANLGAQPSWDPVRWSALVRQKKSLRAQLNRARNKSVRVDEWMHVDEAGRAPNGTAELLVDAAVRAVADQGARYVTLGLAPLSRHSSFDDRRMPAWLRLVLRVVRAHGRRFYDFEGLDRFKSKFVPDEWENIVALADAPRFPPRALWAIASAFSRGSPVALVAGALVRAVLQEARWLRSGARRALQRRRVRP